MRSLSLFVVLTLSAVAATRHQEDHLIQRDYKRDNSSITLSTTAGKNSFAVAIMTDADTADQAIIRIHYYARENKQDILREAICFRPVWQRRQSSCDPMPIAQERVRDVVVLLLSRVDEQTFELSKLEHVN
jgi:hypothetical protein